MLFILRNNEAIVRLFFLICHNSGISYQNANQLSENKN